MGVGYVLGLGLGLGFELGERSRCVGLGSWFSSRARKYTNAISHLVSCLGIRCRALTARTAGRASSPVARVSAPCRRAGRSKRDATRGGTGGPCFIGCDLRSWSGQALRCRTRSLRSRSYGKGALRAAPSFIKTNGFFSRDLSGAISPTIGDQREKRFYYRLYRCLSKQVVGGLRKLFGARLPVACGRA